MRPRSAAIALLLLAVCGCGGAKEEAPEDAPVKVTAASETQVRPPAPPTSGALTRIPDAPAARARLAYVAVDQLAGVDLPFSEAQLLDVVLGRGAAVVSELPDGAAVSAVQVGRDATVLRGSGMETIDGVPSGDDGVVVGVSGPDAQLLADSHPATTAITAFAQRAVQACLGDTLAQTILGPETMGDDAALGVALADGTNEPVGLQLRICAAPRFERDVHAIEKTLAKRFDGVGEVGEQEFVERDIVGAIVPLDELPEADVLELLSGGETLRSLGRR